VWLRDHPVRGDTSRMSRAGARRVTCRDAVGLLGDYLEATLTSDRLARLEEHLEGCPPCRAYLNTYRRTRDLTARLGRVEMPAEMKVRLCAFLLEQLALGRGSGSPDELPEGPHP
jgi:hypothetical protein